MCCVTLYKWRAKYGGIALREALQQVTNSPLGAEALSNEVDKQMEYFRQSRTEEAVFFDEIGVDKELTLHGLCPANLQKLEASGKLGWTYSVQGVKRLGLHDVTYLGDGHYATSHAVRNNFLLIEFDPAL